MNKNSKISISVIIPVFNEEATLLIILKKFNQLIDRAEFELIVVNDGSTDSTKKIIEDNSKLYNKAIHLKKNQGKGKAIIEGLKNSTKDYIFFQDADLEYTPNDILKFINIVDDYKADLIIGSRFIGNTRSVLYFWHMIGNKFITSIFNILNNTTFTDIYCCYCLFKKKNLNFKLLKCYNWGQQAEILTYVAKKSKRIFETSVNYNARKYNEGKKIHYYNVFEVIYWIILTRIKIFKTFF